jgi:ubiquinone/menaquinone biosynthesis C-methylase UbiE
VGLRDGRYVDAELPTLPFQDRSFGLAVCSHFLFLYSDHLDAEFHQRAVLELCRVAREVRIFPLLALGAQASAHVRGIQGHVRRLGYQVSLEVVPYEFQRGANQMMRIRP